MRASASIRIGVVLTMMATLMAVAPAAAQAAPLSGVSCEAAGADIWAKSEAVPMPGSASPVTVWGYAATSGGAVSVADTVIVATQGQACSVTLHNTLPQPTGLMFQGQALVPDRSGIAAGNVTETTKTYTFTPVQPGTYLYESGMLPGTQYQTAMGLHGALIVRPADWATTGAMTDYGSATTLNTGFTDEAVVVLGELDPALNDSAAPQAFDLRNFAPKFYTINGKAFPNTAPIPVSFGGTALLRYVNAGLLPHSMGLLGLDQRFISSDGGLLGGAAAPAPEGQSARSIAPGETTDSLVTVPATAAGLQFPLYDQSKLLNNNNAGTNQLGAGQPGRIYDLGGMMTLIQVGGSGTGGGGGPITSNIVITPSRTSAGPVQVTADIDSGTNAELFIDQSTGAGLIPDSVTLGVATWNAVDVSTLSTGTHSILIHATTDGVAFGPYDHATLTIDNQGPAITGMTLSPNSANSSAVVIGATANDTATGGSNISTATYSIDGGTPLAMQVAAIVTPISALSATIPAATAGALGEGPHIVLVSATDALGQTGTGTITLTIDRSGPSTDTVSASPSACVVPTVPPATACTNGKVGVDASTQAVRISAHFADAASTVRSAEMFIGTVGANGTGAPFLPEDGSFDFGQEYGYADIPLSTIILKPEGDITLSIHGKDAAGNWGPMTTFVLHIDKTAPVVTTPVTNPVGVTNGATGNATSFVLTTTATDTGAFPTGIVAGEWFEGTDPNVGPKFAMSFVNMPAGDNSENLTATIDFVSLGWTPGTHTISVRALDGAGTWSAARSVTINVVYPNALFSNSFEPATGSIQPFGWSSASGTSRLSLVNAAAMPLVAGNTRGLQTQLACNNAACATALTSYVTDNTPSLDAEYHARFYFNPNGAVLANRVATIFAGYSGNNGGGTQVFRIEARLNAGQYQVRIGIARSNGSSPVFSGWTNVNNAANSIEMSWRSATGGTAKVTFTVNGTAVTLTPAIPNNANTSANTLGSVRLGPSAFTGTGTVSGSLRFDSFVSTRRTVIGP